MAKPGKVPRIRYLTEKKKKLAEDNLPLVWWFIDKKLKDRPNNLNALDEIGEKLIERLCIAADTFDPSRGYTFSTYVFYAFLTGVREYKRAEELYNRNLIFMNFNSPEQKEKEEIAPFYFGSRFAPSSTTTWEDLDPLIENANLTKRERRIIDLHYHLNYSFPKIGELFNRSRERIRQLHNSAIKKIKSFVQQQNFYLEDFLHEVR